MPEQLAQRRQTPDPVRAGHPVGHLEVQGASGEPHPVAVAVDEVGAAQRIGEAGGHVGLVDDVGVDVHDPPRAPLRWPSCETVCRRSGGSARSIGMSKIDEDGRGRAASGGIASLARCSSRKACAVTWAEHPTPQTGKCHFDAVGRDRRARCGRAAAARMGPLHRASSSARCSSEPVWDSDLATGSGRGSGARDRVRAAGLPAGSETAPGGAGARPQLLSAAVPALPGRGHDPRPGLRDLAAGLRAGDAGQVRVITPLRGALGGAESSARRRSPPSDVCRRYGVDPDEGAGDPGGAGAADQRSATGRPPPGIPYILAVGDLRAQEEPRGAGRAPTSCSGAVARSPTGWCWPGRLRRGTAAARAGRRRAGGADRLRRRRAARRAAAAAPSCWCTRACTRASGWSCWRRWRAGPRCWPPRATALPETGGEAAAYFDPGEPADLERRLRWLLGDASGGRSSHAVDVARAAQFSWAATARADRRGIPRAAVNTTILLLSVDEAPMLERSLPAALAQEPAAEVVVVDNACTDATAAAGRAPRGAPSGASSRAAAMRRRSTWPSPQHRRRRGAAAQRRLLPAPRGSWRRRCPGSTSDGVGSVAPKLLRAPRPRRGPRSTPPGCSSTAGARTGWWVTAVPPSASPAPPRRSAPTARPRCTGGPP